MRRRRAHELLAAADTICCSTTASEPLFDGHVVADHTTVVAIGSHEPDARDVHDALVGRDGGRRVELLGAARGACVTAPRRHRSLAVSRERQPAMHLSRNGLPLPRELGTLAETRLAPAGDERQQRPAGARWVLLRVRLRACPRRWWPLPGTHSRRRGINSGLDRADGWSGVVGRAPPRRRRSRTAVRGRALPLRREVAGRVAPCSRPSRRPLRQRA
jgi:hypothetical protein